ncbi:MAG: DUF805 domain-containing protein [Alphaproteobacteria bacterium]|nr:DUF805 domain-containing protein [Alphaproteobacteria bacterium]
MLRSVARFFTDFDGRSGRRQYILPMLGFVGSAIAMRYLAGLAFGGPILMPKDATDLVAFSEVYHKRAAITAICSLLLTPLMLALHARRFHDRNMSGWWNAILLLLGWLPILLQIMGVAENLELDASGFCRAVPTPIKTLQVWLTMVPVLWLSIELYLRRGTQGPNRFGPDPLAES